MSTLIISCRANVRHQQPSSESTSTFGASHWSAAEGLIQWSLSRWDSETLWAPATHSSSKRTCLIAGRIALPNDEWDRAGGLPHSGGLAARHVLKAYAHHGKDFAATLNGAFCAVVVDPEDRTLTIATDRMGFLPVFAYGDERDPILSTHPDVVAQQASVQNSIDVVSLAEVAHLGRASHPYTYYSGVRCLEPGHVYVWQEGRLIEKRSYWSPTYRVDPNAGVSELAGDLVSAWRRAVALRSLPRLGKTGVLLSGGADSRAVLYATSEPAAAMSITLISEPNAELATAKALAERVGSRHVALQRDFEHYGLGAEEAVRATGGMWNLLDAHYTALSDEIRTLAEGTLLSGCYADYLFKGLTSNRDYRRIAGRALPVYRFAPFNHRWYAPRGEVNPDFSNELAARLEASYDGLDLTDESDANRWEIERRRIVPVSYEADTAGRLLMLRTLRWDPIFADSGLIDMWQRIPPSLKLNGQVWEKAVARICRAAGDVINNNSQSRIGAPIPLKVVAFLKGVAYRKVFGRDLDGSDPQGFAGRGSWPNFGYYYRHSRVVPDLWKPRSVETREVLHEVLGFDPWSRSLDEWAARAHSFSRVLTLKLWLDQRANASIAIRPVVETDATPRE